MNPELRVLEDRPAEAEAERYRIALDEIAAVSIFAQRFPGAEQEALQVIDDHIRRAR